MNKKSLSKINRMEQRIYEMIGIKLFRKIIFFFEKVKHRKDGGQNKNYHIKGTSIYSINVFVGYLLYNTAFHIVGILMAFVFFLLSWLLQSNYLWLDIFMYLTVVFNLYCIMLQRYVYLKLKSHIIQVITKRNQRIQTASNKLISFLETKDKNDILEEYSIIEKISYSMTTGADCVLCSNCTDILNRLAVEAEIAEISISPKPTKHISHPTLSQILLNLENKTYLIGRTEQCVSRLQFLLKQPINNNVLFGYSIITEDSQCETAFCRLFPVRNREKIEFTIAVFLTAYRQKGLVNQ